MIRIVALMLATACALAPAPVLAQQAPSMSIKELHATTLAAARGKLIRAYDQAAWHGTDAMFARIQHPEDVIGGWIVDGPAHAPVLVFFDRNDADPHAVFVVEFLDGKIVATRLIGEGDDASLSPERKAMIAARERGIAAWREEKPLYCADKPPNTVVLPPEQPGEPYLVYLLTPQVKDRAWPAGGHFRAEIAADGRVLAKRSFTRSCVTLEAPADKDAAALMVTHPLDPVPTEIHVFTALTSGMTLYVGAGGRLWVVEGTRIYLADPPKKR
ncbi:hypothetical protein ACFQ1E_19450 [Sphingomonas canadensis]|uniref:Uncharacterized protein n=1 Tax=Sphingomonas canadensis TaxID=1219257 RepID=A0ABW3HAP7_9SPHN|nr:hypothetical protein [Sphingomonas canadensis]MCW3838140.1 hypothetical protein [Sphingomonas canadensis]